MARKMVAFTGVLALLCQASVARPKQADAVSLTVSAFNDAAVPPSVLLTARARAQSVFAEAGITLTWLDCGTPGRSAANTDCTAIAYPAHLSLRLAKDGTHRAKDTFGESFVDDRGQGNYASVYVTALDSSPALRVLSEGELLGYVVVHELGHLLLGKDSHSPQGVMRPVWGFEDLEQAAHGKLCFTPDQVERMRATYLAANLRQKAAPARTSSASGPISLARLSPPSGW
jgi:hypothetical protein